MTINNDKHKYNLKFLGIEEVELEYDFKRKFNSATVNINNTKALNELIKEAELLVNDPSKNEKIAIQFRAIQSNENSQNKIFDVSRIFDKDGQGKLLDGVLIYELIDLYKQYLLEHHLEKNYVIEIIKVYYPLDKDNKIENIPDLGNLVEYSKDGNTWTVDCRVKPTPNLKTLETLPPMAQSITELRKLYTEDEQLNIDSKLKTIK